MYYSLNKHSNHTSKAYYAINIDSYLTYYIHNLIQSYPPQSKMYENSAWRRISDDAPWKGGQKPLSSRTSPFLVFSHHFSNQAHSCAIGCSKIYPCQKFLGTAWQSSQHPLKMLKYTFVLCVCSFWMGLTNSFN